MNLFVSEIVTPPSHLPVTVDSAQDALARAVVEEIERGVLWRAIVAQERRITIDGPLPLALRSSLLPQSSASPDGRPHASPSVKPVDGVALAQRIPPP